MKYRRRVLTSLQKTLMYWATDHCFEDWVEHPVTTRLFQRGPRQFVAGADEQSLVFCWRKWENVRLCATLGR